MSGGKRGQSSTEYVMIIGLILVLLIPLFWYAWQRTNTDVKENKAADCVQSLQQAADEVYSLSPGSKKFITCYVPGSVKYSTSELFENARDNINWLKSFLPEKILIGVENNNYYPTKAYEHVTDSDFITKVVKDNKLRFLLDISHAKITSHNRKIPYVEYISNLPMDETIQLHVCKNEINNLGLAVDVHNVPDDDIYEEVAELIKKYPIEYITIEYYRDKDSLVSELKRYRELCKNTQSSLREV